MSSINDLDNLQELKSMYDFFTKYLTLDIQHLVKIADNETNREYEQSKIVYSSTTTNKTTRRPGDHISEIEQPVKSRCTIPLAMLLFSAIDFIGKLAEPVQENSSQQFTNTDGFAKNAQIFFHHLCDVDYLKNDTKAKVFMEKYRHNIMHSFLPGSGDRNAQYSIAYFHKDLSNILFEKIETEEVLNVNV